MLLFKKKTKKKKFFKKKVNFFNQKKDQFFQPKKLSMVTDENREKKQSLCKEIRTRLVGMTARELIEQRDSFKDSLKTLSELTNSGGFDIQNVFCPNKYRSLVDGVVKVDHLDPNAEAWDLCGKTNTMNVSPLDEWIPVFRVELCFEGPFFGRAQECWLENLPGEAKVYAVKFYTA